MITTWNRKYILKYGYYCCLAYTMFCLLYVRSNQKPASVTLFFSSHSGRERDAPPNRNSSACFHYVKSTREQNSPTKLLPSPNDTRKSANKCNKWIIITIALFESRPKSVCARQLKANNSRGKLDDFLVPGKSIAVQLDGNRGYVVSCVKLMGLNLLSLSLPFSPFSLSLMLRGSYFPTRCGVY